MNIFLTVYTEVLFRPLYNLLVGITNLLPTHDVGVAIILVTIIVRFILLPSSLHQVRQAQRNQLKMAELQKDLKKIREQHQKDRTKQAEATMQLYRRAGINPAAGCLPLIIQLPILIALYRVFFIGLGPETFHNLYRFVAEPQSLGLEFAGITLTQSSLLLGVIAGVAQFILTRFFTGTPAAQPGGSEETAQLMASMQKNMAYIFPVMTVFIALQVPAALALYWVASTVIAIIQQYVFKRIFKTAGTLPAV